MVGGAPVTQEYADAVGADGYAADASTAVRRAKELLGQTRAWSPPNNVTSVVARGGERPVITAEMPSIDGGGLDQFREAPGRIAPYVDAINATDNPAAHAHASNVAIAIAMLQAGSEPIMQVVCRDKNRLAIQADIMGAAMFGVRNICALTGDDVTAGDEPEARRVFDLDGPQLVSVAAGLGQGHYLSGRTIEPAPDLFVGAVETPFAPPTDYRVQRAKIKSDAGARFLQPQIGYQPELLESFVRGCGDLGVLERPTCCPLSVWSAEPVHCGSWTVRCQESACRPMSSTELRTPLTKLPRHTN